MFRTGRQTQVGKRGGQSITPRGLDDPERVEGLWSAWFVPAEPQDQATDPYTGSVCRVVTRPSDDPRPHQGRSKGGLGKRLTIQRTTDGDRRPLRGGKEGGQPVPAVAGREQGSPGPTGRTKQELTWRVLGAVLRV